MPHALRMRVAVGLYAVLLGLMIAYGVPLLWVFANVPEALSLGTTRRNPMEVYRAASLTHDLTMFNGMITIAWCIAAVGGLLAFFSWMSWLTRPDDARPKG